MHAKELQVSDLFLITSRVFLLIPRGAGAKWQLPDFIHCAPPLSYVLIRILKLPRFLRISHFVTEEEDRLR